jgi:hypothetical protein
MAIANGETIDASDFIGNPAPFFSIENTIGGTHSLTTVANQRVLVIAKGSFTGSSAANVVSLQYNGVTKDSVKMRLGSSVDNMPFTLMYTEVPGAATQNVTLTTSVGSLEDLDIVVTKLRIG